MNGIEWSGSIVYYFGNVMREYDTDSQQFGHPSQWSDWRNTSYQVVAGATKKNGRWEKSNPAFGMVDINCSQVPK